MISPAGRVLILVLVLALTTFAPDVKAQLTSISAVNAPPTALLGIPVNVTVTSGYSLGLNGYAVSVGIWDLYSVGTGLEKWARGTGWSSSGECELNNTALCVYTPNATSGSYSATFELTFSMVKTYWMKAVVELYDRKYALVPNTDTVNDFSISVSPNPNVTNFIYGGLAGPPADAAIRAVSFSLQADNLVTTFQVQGRISTAYAYHIDVKSDPTNNQADYVIGYNYNGSYNGQGSSPYFHDVRKNMTSIPNSSVNGNTWTASVPMSWINGLTHFWATAASLQYRNTGIVYLVDAAPFGVPFGNLEYAEINLPGAPTVEVTQSSTVSSIRQSASSSSGTNSVWYGVGFALVAVIIVLGAVSLAHRRRKGASHKSASQMRRAHFTFAYETPCCLQRRRRNRILIGLAPELL